MTNIDRIMYLLDWDRTPAEQREGLSLAREVVCINAFFQPIGPSYSKSVWDNCATVICERSDQELQPYLTDMILWLQDLNWPGAEQIQQRLIAFGDVDRLALLLNSIVPALEKLGKSSWLIFLSDLLNNQKLGRTINDCTKEILAKYTCY